MVQAYNGILLSPKEEGNNAICSNMKGFRDYHSKLLHPWDSPGKNTGAGCHALLQGIFPTQGWNPGLPRCRWVLYCLNHQGSPRTMEWGSHPFSGKVPDPGIEMGSPVLQEDSLHICVCIYIYMHTHITALEVN